MEEDVSIRPNKRTQRTAFVFIKKKKKSPEELEQSRTPSGASEKMKQSS